MKATVNRKFIALISVFFTLFAYLSLNPISAHAAGNDVTGTVSVVTGSGSVLLPGVTVTATSAKAESADAASSPVTATTNASGVYTLALTAFNDWTIQFVKANYTSASETNVDSTGGNTLNKELTYVHGIWGRVVTDSTPQASVTVVAHSSSTGAIVSTTTTNATGYYIFPGLSNGSYKVEFVKDTYQTEWYSGTPNKSYVFSTAGSVSVTSNSKTEVSTAALAVPANTLTPSPTPNPSVSGTAQVGSTLTASTGSGWGTDVTFAYQWQKSTTTAFELGNTSDIEGAILPTYEIQSTDFNYYIRARVIGRKANTSDYVRYSATTAVVAMYSITPTITGTTTVGQVLTASTGSWLPTPSFTYQWKRNGINISSATSSTYTLVSADADSAITVTVTGTVDAVAVSKTSAATGLVGRLISVSPDPTISGSAVVGKVLSAVVGAWTPSSVGFTYQWNRNGTAISGATSSSYTLVTADLNNYIAVTVTGSLSGYTSVTKSSAATTAVLDKLTATPIPKITGVSTVGSVLTADPGTWAPSTVTLSYQWYRNSVAISGATGVTYTVVEADNLTNITVKVTGSKPGYGTESTTSATFVVGRQFVNHNAPTVSGNIWLGQTLRATVGLWDTVATLTHQWYRDGVAITGATSHSYKLVSADVGHKITVATTGTAAGYISQTSTSAPTSIVLNGKPFTKAATPVITGTLKVGKTLGTNSGYWNPTPAKVTYQWLRNLVPITGATKSTYKLTALDKGTSIRVRITVTRTGYATTTKVSRPSAEVK